MSRKYNFIFKELTGGDSNNILGLIAYSIYKNDKIKFIEDWESNNNGELCPDDEINRFHKDSMRRISHYRELENVRHTPCYTSFFQRIQAKAR